MDKIDERIASYERYKMLRIRYGYDSDYKISKETGITKATFSEWSKGNYEPKLDKMMKIAKVLGITLEELVGA